MNHINDLLLHLVRCELWNQPCKVNSLQPQVYHVLHNLAVKQTVTGLVWSTLLEQHVQLDSQDAINLFVGLQSISRQNKLVSKALVELTNLFNSHQIDFVVVKGQTLALNYRHPEYRMPGDIDFYLDEANFSKARQVLSNEWHVVFDEEDNESEQHLGFTHDKVSFEMHFRLFKFASRRNQRCFDKMLAESKPAFVKINEVDVPVLPPYLNIVYTFLHLWHHLIELGVGLRQFCDLAMLLHVTDSKVGRDAMMAISQLGFTKAFKAIAYILSNDLGLSIADLPFQKPIESKSYHKTMMDIVFKRGNFGMYGRKNQVRSGFKYFIESFGIKLSHYTRLFKLAPRENCAVLFYTIPSKIVYALKGNYGKHS